MTATQPRVTKTKISATNAAKRASSKLGLDDEKSLTIAILEAAMEEVNNNSRFAQNIKMFYEALIATQTPKPVKAIHRNVEEERFTPVKIVEGIEINIAATPDPFLMCEAYGAEQFRRMLQRETKTRLLDNVSLIQKQRPGVKLPNKSKAAKEEIIEFIITHVS